MSDSQAKFEGWAVVELYGHQKETGFVTTQYFGTGALFQIDVPPMDEKEVTLTSPEWCDGQYCPVGSVVIRGALEGRSRFVGMGAIYALNPCTEDVARKMLENRDRQHKVVSVPARAELPSETLPGEYELDFGNEDDAA